MESTALEVVAPEPAKVLLKNADLAFVLALLDGDGESARLVGGALRNALLGRPVHEFDIATTAAPKIVMARAQKAHVRCIPTGVEHGTVTLVVSGRGFEVTSLREDIETDGRRAKVRFSRDFARDALRRDFTVNALSMNLQGQLFDYVGGLADIQARRLRFIGDPVARIREDYLRILRFFRFTAEYAEGPLDAAGLAAAMRERDGLQRLSRERIRNEILKLLSARRGAEIAEEMCHAGLLGPLLAVAPNPARLRNLFLRAPEASRDPLLGLAALCVNIAEDAENLRERLRLSNSEERRLASAGEAFMRLHEDEQTPSRQELLYLLFRFGRQAAEDALLLACAEARADDVAQWQAAYRDLREIRVPHLPVSGTDFLNRGVPNGRPVGAALKDVEARWIAAGFPEDPARIAELIEAAASAAKNGSRGET